MNITQKINEGLLLPEVEFKMSRSSGPGGQHVNKTNTRVSLIFNVGNSAVLDEEEKTILIEKLANKLDNETNLIIHAQEKRSQIQNKEIAIRKFHDLMRKAFERKKIRKVSKPGKAAIEKRLSEKKALSQKKRERSGDW
ncbi:alternative ribosome rescue aminoacyl-tRNA hydrolase ArfB [Cecembia calidifontis]|uniref:Ribosome-associated protein n=1 Tax=Cecembia calidifontis TaxID=1187080 RepID=A0A4Q7PBB9_9BACT|nr:alternative ribosome rescue aminoacyl-tRNA hydrolase ArfB [Cecembia calidifontis]RZS97593.1 ribosome-associated protein [Cecembia calidifontis]